MISCQLVTCCMWKVTFVIFTLLLTLGMSQSNCPEDKKCFLLNYTCDTALEFPEWKKVTVRGFLVKSEDEYVQLGVKEDQPVNEYFQLELNKVEVGKDENVLLSIDLNYCASHFLMVDKDITKEYKRKTVPVLDLGAIKLELLMEDKYEPELYKQNQVN